MSDGPYTALTAGQIRDKLAGIRDARSIRDHASRLTHWDNCWALNAKAPYFGPAEHERFAALRVQLFRKYFEGVKDVVEFGCGAGENLQVLRELGHEVLGTDWSQAAVERVAARGMLAVRADMFRPVEIMLAGHGVLTVHAMEQLGENFSTFMWSLIAAKPRVVLHIEPVYELYDPLNLDDFLAMCYHDARGYLKGYLPRLLDLHHEGKIKLLEATRSAFGNLHHKAYAVIAWRPL